MDSEADGRLAAYAASGCGGLFALVSLYWALGGTLGLDTVGGFATSLARSGGTTATVVLAAVVVAKCLGAALALALVQRWGRVLPQGGLLTIAGAASSLLILYGGILVVTEALVEARVVRLATPVDWRALGWHLGLWDMWFLVWGLLLGAATWSSLGRRRRTRSAGALIPASAHSREA